MRPQSAALTLGTREQLFAEIDDAKRRVQQGLMTREQWRTFVAVARPRWEQKMDEQHDNLNKLMNLESEMDAAGCEYESCFPEAPPDFEL